MSRKVLLGGILLLGFALRFYRLNAVPLRGDEAFTVIHWMREPLAQTLANIATVDPQAPLSYALFRGWALIFGTSEDVARLLPALLSVIGIAAMYALGHRLRGARLGLLAAFLWAINPDQIWHAQDARNYAIWAMLSLLALWLALRALDRQRRVDWLLYILAGALAAYVYYLEAFVIIALNLYVFVTRWRDRRLLLRWIGAEAIIGLLLAPWYLQPRLLYGSGYGGTAGGFDPALWVTRFLPTLTFGGSLPDDVMGTLGIILMLVLLVGLVLWARRNKGQALLFGLVGALPLLLLGVVSTKLNVFEPRYVLAAAPAYTLILCVLAFRLRYRVLVASGFVIVAVVSVSTLGNYYFVPDYAKSPDWRALASYLSANVASGDWVTQAAADESFTFYCNEYQIPANCDDKLPANPDQSEEEIDQLLAERSAQHPAIWYVASPPPGWTNRNFAEDWLTAQLQEVRSTSANGLRAQEFKSWTVAPEEISTAPLATFGGAADLVGYRRFAEPTADMTVWLYWRAVSPTDAPLKIFLHLTSGDQIVSQDDQYPQDGRISTVSWDVGTVYRDVYTLPLAGVPSGDYALRVGWYDPETNRRLPVGDGDSYFIETIHLP